MRIRTVAAGLLALVSIGLTASPALAAPAADKGLCKDGGFASYVDPSTGAPFANQGQCVSFVNGGGALVPVRVPAVQLSFVAAVFSDSDHPNGATFCEIFATLTGFAPNEPVTLRSTVVSPTGFVSGPFVFAVVTGPDGTLYTQSGSTVPQQDGWQTSATVTDSSGAVVATAPLIPVTC